LRANAEGQITLAYAPQLSYGLLPALDLIVQPTWLRLRDAEGVTARGLGDTNLDVKWRFYGSAPYSLGLRAGVAVPTSGPGLGLRRGTWAGHGVLVLTYDEQPFTVHGNLGYTRTPAADSQRRDLAHLSGALMWAPDESLTFSLEASGDTNPDRSGRRWLTTALAGLIYTVRPGLDVDVGYQAAVLGATPSRSWLIGLTYRFAL
jgi:hypothetical protein